MLQKSPFGHLEAVRSWKLLMESILRNSCNWSFCWILIVGDFRNGLAFKSNNTFFLSFNVLFFKMSNTNYRMFAPFPIIMVDKLNPFLMQVIVLGKRNRRMYRPTCIVRGESHIDFSTLRVVPGTRRSNSRCVAILNAKNLKFLSIILSLPKPFFRKQAYERVKLDIMRCNKSVTRGVYTLSLIRIAWKYQVSTILNFHNIYKQFHIYPHHQSCVLWLIDSLQN